MELSLPTNFLLHPPLSAFPVAILTLTLLFEMLSVYRPWRWLRGAAGACLIAGAISVMLAFFSGYSASEHADRTFQVPDDVIGWHHTVGRLLLFCTLPCLVLKVLSGRAQFGRSGFLAAYLVFLVLCVGLVLYAGYLGGQLVFGYGAGVYAPIPHAQ